MISVRKRTWLLVGLALWWCLTPVRVWGVSTSASAAVLMDADTGQVLYDHNGGRRMLIASTTKIMTALVVLERASPTDVITVKQEHMTEGSSMYLKPGEGHRSGAPGHGPGGELHRQEEGGKRNVLSE